MNYKVKIESRDLSINLMHHSTVDLGIFAVKATTHSFLFDGIKTQWGADINETELKKLVAYMRKSLFQYCSFRQLIRKF